MCAFVIAVVLTATAAFAASVPAITPVGPKPLSAALLTTSQAKILTSASFKVRVEARRTGRVKVAVSTSTAGGKPKRVTTPVTVAFNRPHARILRLRLSKAGAAKIAACSHQTLTLTARPKGKLAQAAAGVRAVSVADLDLDSAACTSLSGGGGSPTGPGGGPENPAPQPYTGAPIATSNSNRCDFLDTAVCLQPFPNDYFTVGDPSTDTGRRVNFSQQSMPANQPLGSPVPITHIDPTEWNRNDGFSPGNMIITRVPGLDNQQAFVNSGLVPITDMARYADPNQSVVVIDAATGERQPIWAELDANPSNPTERNLIIRPARNFTEGHRYIVALRNLKDDAGATIQPEDGFRVYRDNLITNQPEVESRRAHFEDLFASLHTAGVQRSNLFLTWDFTVASERNLSERMLSIRNDAFHQLGDNNLADGVVQGNPPQVNISSSTDYTAAQNSNIARIVQGNVTVPCYLNTLGCQPVGSRFNTGGNGLPSQLLGINTMTANFECIIPRAAIDGPSPQPSRLSLYGHGLLGSFSEVEAGNVEAMANEHDVTFCATDWFGFANANLANVLLILQDVSLFPTLVDQSQQGMLNFLYLGRAMIHPDGLGANAAFQSGGHPVVDSSHLYYDGNSQGGILGGALTAVAPDFNRAVLGVPAMNYSTLLERSTDFRPYAEGEFTSQVCDLLPSPLNDVCTAALPGDTPLGLYDNYPNQIERPLIFSLMQMLWDRSEPDGYAQHMTSDPLPDTPPHEVLMQPAFGDHQVANVAAEVEARTIGASAYKPAFDPGRSLDTTPLFGIPSIPSFPFDGSAIVFYDGGAPPLPGGTTPPPTTDTPPVNGIPGNGADPHSYPRNDIKARAQKSAFLMPNGMVENYCLAENNGLTDPTLLTLTGTPTPCYSHGYTGP
ncbi:MAG: hypothetical protein QOD60_2079 [Solirubrobacterales bacterium]|nr:hypothetical protein [Solirubrobacterales bacterium]